MRLELFNARKKAGLTQGQLAAKAGIDRTVYNRIERGIRKPTVDVALKIAQILDCQVEKIFLPDDVLKKHEDKKSPPRVRWCRIGGTSMNSSIDELIKKIRQEEREEVKSMMGPSCAQCRAAHPQCDECCYVCIQPCNTKQVCRYDTQSIRFILKNSG